MLSNEERLEFLVRKLDLDCDDYYERIPVYMSILEVASEILDDYHVPDCGEIYDKKVCAFYYKQYQKVMPLLKAKGYIRDKRAILTRPGI